MVRFEKPEMEIVTFSEEAVVCSGCPTNCRTVCDSKCKDVCSGDCTDVGD